MTKTMSFDEQLDLHLSAKDVGPEARKKLSGLLKYYAKQPHPFTKCVRDNRKRFGPGRTEAVCATLKDIIRGTTKWRGNEDKDKGAAGIANLAEVWDTDDSDLPQEVLDIINELSDEQLLELIDLAELELQEDDDEEASESEDDMKDETGVQMAEPTLENPVPEGIPARMAYGEAKKAGINCGTCSFYSEGDCDKYDAPVKKDMVCKAYAADADSIDYQNMAELCFSEVQSPVQDPAKGVWKKVLRTGRWDLTPGGQGTAVQKPLTVVRGKGRTDHVQGVVSLDDIVDSYEASAVQHVTVPLEHTSAPDKNTGYVQSLAIEEDGEQSYLKALIGFTEPEIENKVLNGSIANTSVGLKFDYRRKNDGEKHNVVLDHVALTNKPWIDGLPGFGLSEQGSDDVPVFVYTNNDEAGGSMKGDTETQDADLKLSELQTENTGLTDENRRLRAQLRKGEVKERIDALSKKGLGSYPGFLKQVKAIYLADEGEALLELSEDGGSKKMTATDIVDSLIATLPRKSALKLSEQAEDTGAEKPSNDASDEVPHEDKVKQASEFLAGKA